MDQSTPTVTVEPLKGLPALKMTWQHEVLERDVDSAFRVIASALSATDKPLFIIVDIRANPHFPLTATLSGARDPYRHPMLAEWLIVGSNRFARVIEDILSSLTHRKNVTWYDTEAEALAVIRARLSSASDPAPASG